MLELEDFEPIYHVIEQERDLYLSRLIERWNEPIELTLNRLARTIWPAKHIWGLIPVKTYRLMSQRINQKTHLWWVEHEVATKAGNQCLAYGVELCLDELGQPIVTVQSGETIYPVVVANVEALEATLAQASCDQPMILKR